MIAAVTQSLSYTPTLSPKGFVKPDLRDVINSLPCWVRINVVHRLKETAYTFAYTNTTLGPHFTSHYYIHEGIEATQEAGTIWVTWAGSGEKSFQLILSMRRLQFKSDISGCYYNVVTLSQVGSPLVSFLILTFRLLSILVVYSIPTSNPPSCLFSPCNVPELNLLPNNKKDTKVPGIQIFITFESEVLSKTYISFGHWTRFE